jgi:tetratricopeptide (TPR) repeat protein
VVHEVIKSLDSHEKSYAMLEDVVNAISWDGMRSQDPEKYHKDAQVLEKALEKDPTNTRNTFYLAKSYQDSNEPLKALETFKKRSLMGQFDLEVHWSLYQIGILEEKLNMPHETVVASYCKAYQSCPERAEPLYQLARYYNKCEKYVLSYVITQYALTLPEPKESLFLEAWIYEFGNLIEFSTAAYKIGKYEEAQKACVQLLSKSNLPEVIRPSIENNLSCLKDIERK